MDVGEEEECVTVGAFGLAGVALGGTPWHGGWESEIFNKNVFPHSLNVEVFFPSLPIPWAGGLAPS